MVNTAHVYAFVLTVASAVLGEQDYYCRFGGDHTMCLYKGVGLKCFPRLRGGVSVTAQTSILNTHNAFRQKVAEGHETRGCPGPQPPAANMRMMEWSSEMAMIAQRWADQCTFSKDSCRSVANFRTAGQAVYQQSSPTNGTLPLPDWASVISAWYDQVWEFDKAAICPFVSRKAVDYSQVVWAETYQVGCGYTVYRHKSDPYCTIQLYVCNYGPGGNISGGSVYQKGHACTKCPPRTTCRSPEYPALCL